MTNSKRNPSRSGGWRITDILRDVAITWQLMRDPRVSSLLKLGLPVFALLYWLSPIDLLTGMPFDDLAILILATRIFVQMAPPEAVEEALRRLGRFGGANAGAWTNWDDDENTIPGEWRVVDDE